MTDHSAVALSAREFSVLSQIVLGLSDKEIAVQLGVSASTVHKHVGRILEKLHVNSRTEAAVRAVREAII
jgi:DNA-binding NarL/FixJ family response regulator